MRKKFVCRKCHFEVTIESDVVTPDFPRPPKKCYRCGSHGSFDKKEEGDGLAGNDSA